jgi:hypothetical protein
MTENTLEQVIVEGIKGLPADSLKEIADFVVFVRKKKLDPQGFHDDLQGLGLNIHLKMLSREEEKHLEQEFADYEQRFPRE